MNSRLLLWCVALFALCFVVNTRHNKFPWYYHPDEPGKVEQVMEGSWNMHHPLLLLGATKVVTELRGDKSNEQAIVETGRNISALFIAGAVVALSLLAYNWRGWTAALLTGVLLATHHQLYELSHYFKEDSALLFGVACAALATRLYANRPMPLPAAFLGFACALAISGKYIGAMTLLLALPILIRVRAEKPGRVWLAFAVALVVGIAAINFPLFSHFGTFEQSLHREVSLVAEGQGGATRRVPHSEYWTIFRDNTTPLIWAALVMFLASCWRERKTLKVADWTMIALPFVYTIALSFSPKTNDRYFLPATAIFTLLSALAISDVPRRWAPIAALLMVAAQFPSWSASRPGWFAYECAFQRDDNAELIDYLRDTVPAEAVLLKDNRISLPDPEKKKHAARVGVIPQKVIGRRYAADFADFDELLARGVTHVIVSETDYGKYFRNSLRPQKGAEEKFDRSREFYTRLFSENESSLLWERERGTVIYLHPGIRLYRLRPSGSR